VCGGGGGPRARGRRPLVSASILYLRQQRYVIEICLHLHRVCVCTPCLRLSCVTVQIHGVFDCISGVFDRYMVSLAVSLTVSHGHAHQQTRTETTRSVRVCLCSPVHLRASAGARGRTHTHGHARAHRPADARARAVEREMDRWMGDEECAAYAYTRARDVGVDVYARLRAPRLANTRPSQSRQAAYTHTGT
jgi:hypothetical protein